MSTVVVSAVAAAALVVGVAAAPARGAESLDARARSLVMEHTAAATPAARREAIEAMIEELGAGPAAARAAREALLSEPRRPAALALAARLRLPGVFPSARRFAAGPCGAAVVRLALRAPDEGAATWVVDRWRAAEPGSAAEAELAAALAEHPLPPDAADAVAAALGDPARGAGAAEILRAQTGCDDADAADLASRWPALRERFAFEGRTWPFAGTPVLDVAAPGAWRLRAARRVGPNVRIAPGACVDLPQLPDSVARDEGALRVRIAAGDGDGAYVSLMTASGSQELRLRCDGTSWFLVEGPPHEGERVEAPFVRGAWQEVTVRIRDPGLRDRPAARDVRVHVDGKELRPTGGFWRFGEPPASLAVRAAGSRRTDASSREPRGEAPSDPSGRAPSEPPHGSASETAGAAPTLLGGVEWVRCSRP